MIKHEQYTARDFYRIAKYQRRVILVVLGSLLLVFTIFSAYYFSYSVVETTRTYYFEVRSEYVRFSLAVFTIISCSIAVVLLFIQFVMLVIALPGHAIAKILAVIGMFVPMLSHIVLALVLGWAWGALKSAGYPVGILGVSRNTLAELEQIAVTTDGMVAKGL